MADIRAFRALRYNPSRIQDLSRVVTQPYDKISPEMQARYYDSSPFNLARIIKGRAGAADNPQDNVYTRAARDVRKWREDGILISETAPALYPYDQEYEIPGRPGTRKVRCGFIAIGRVEDYSAKIVHRHEETLSAPKADRMELLKATRTHFGQIFMLYSDPAGTVESLLAEGAEQKPWEQVTDEYATLHTVRRVTEPRVIAKVRAAMADKKLVIADGHHRYETALGYRNLRRLQGADDPGAEYVMMTFVPMEAEGLTILPTHRLVHSLPAFGWDRFLSEARPIFDVEVVPVEGEAGRWANGFLEKLGLAGSERPAFGAYGGPGKLAILRLRGDFDLDRALSDLSPTLRRLDVILLHRLVLERILAIDPQAVREEKNLTYHRGVPAAAAEVEEGKGQLCLLLNPTRVEDVRANALAGQAMPQKSTDFYPKLLSGLTMYWLDNPEGRRR